MPIFEAYGMTVKKFRVFRVFRGQKPFLDAL